MRKPCTIEGCEKPSAGRGWCSTHWARWRTHGDPMVVHRLGVDYSVKPTCSVDGCERPHHARTYCSMHLVRFKKYGDPLFEAPLLGRPLKGGVPTWSAVHKRLSRQRGPASDYTCIECGATAKEWSYNHRDPDELLGTLGQCEVPYSLNLDNYDPRCIPCHRSFDRAGEDRDRDMAGRFI